MFDNGEAMFDDGEAMFDDREAMFEDEEAMFDDREAMFEDREAMFDDREAMLKSLWWGGGGVVGWVPVHRLVTATVRFGCDNKPSSGAEGAKIFLKCQKIINLGKISSDRKKHSCLQKPMRPTVVEDGILSGCYPLMT